MTKRLNRRQGFTLIEILLVIGILATLATVSVVLLMPQKEAANIDTTKLKILDIEKAVEVFYMNMNRYPEEGLEELITAPDDEAEAGNWKGPYIAKIPTDPWGSEIQYEKQDTDDAATKKFHIWSNGPDKESGTDDDIRNWEESE